MSSLKFVLKILLSSDSPPRRDVLRRAVSDYTFAPLGDGGPIYTIDASVWSRRSKGSSVEITSQFCPDKDFVIGALCTDRSESTCVLIGLTSLRNYEPPFSGVRAVQIPLQELYEIVPADCLLGTVDMGFDVVDSVGLSGLSNIGYSSSEVAELDKYGIKTNEFGLVGTFEDASLFAVFASSAAPEHAPFSPLRILKKGPSLGFNGQELE